MYSHHPLTVAVYVDGAGLECISDADGLNKNN